METGCIHDTARRSAVHERFESLAQHSTQSSDALASVGMDNRHMRALGAARPVDCVGRIAMLAAALVPLLVCGCASPGPPEPPSLKLPELVTGLTASRVGGEVRLQWTTPTRTTDKLMITVPVVAEICRETAVLAPASTSAGQNPGKVAIKPPCSPVILRKTVKPGASEATDTLPAELLSAPARLLAYRVQLRNAAGRTAGASAAVYAASGPSPQAVAELSGRATKAGIVLEWKAAAQGTVNREQADEGAESIELDRTILPPASESTAASATSSTTAATNIGSAGKSTLPGAAKKPAESRFRITGAMDAGGTIDRTVQMGGTYRYTVQRVRSVELGGERLEVGSLPSAEVTIVMADEFPPEAPKGLVAVPGFTGANGESTLKPVIDLSWEPNMEAHVAGYRVYRAELDGEAASTWKQLDPELVSVAAYRDLTVAAGRRYAYRVTAVSDVRKESSPSSEVVETAPTP